MKGKFASLGFFILLLFLSPLVSASVYLEILRELDIRVICLLVWLAPLITLLLLVIGGFRFIISEAPEKRDEARGMIYNAIVGFILVFAFILLAGFIGNLNLTRCLGELGKPPVKPILSTPTTSTTSTLLPECDKFSNCQECIDNGCEWCITPFTPGSCYLKKECSTKCVFEHEGLPFAGTCTLNCPQGKITGEYIPC